MNNFNLYTDRVEITTLGGNILTIYFTPNSGKVYFRWKINTVFGVKHPGIFLGIDASSQQWFMHNHIEDGQPSIVKGNTFSKGQRLFPSEDSCENAPLQIIANGLQQVLDGSPYHSLLYNCQTFVNRARSNRNTSEAVVNITGGIILTTLVIAGIKSIANQQ